MKHTPTLHQIAHFNHETAMAAEFEKDFGKEIPHTSSPRVERQVLPSGLIQFRRVHASGPEAWMPSAGAVRGFHGPDAQ